MRIRMLAILAAGAMHAASIHGLIVEKQSGKPLARALVVAQPVAGTRGATRSARANSNGLFEIADLPGGLYVVTASKTGFVTTEYGQKRWFSAGTPVEVADAGEISVRIAMPHFAAITGRVVDDNNLGMAGVTVLAYRDTRPPELVGKATTDDRGAYRLSGLMPGTYLARSDGFQNDLGSYRATFGLQTTSVDNAYTTDGVLDQDTIGTDIRPISGPLLTVSGRVVRPVSSRGPAQVTLVSDMGSLYTSTEEGGFRFERLSTGPYELISTAPDARSGTLEGYLYLEYSTSSNAQVEVAPLQSTQFTFVDTSGRPVDASTLPLLVRRRELSGSGPTTYLMLDGQNQTKLHAGRWEVALAPNASWYVADFSAPRSRRTADTSAGWNEILVDPKAGATAVQLTLSPDTSTLHGVVSGAGVPVAGAPVHLEALNPQSGRRIRDLRTTRTDANGQYSFAGLAPGYYRVLATFDYQAPDTAQITRANGAEVKIAEERDLLRNLVLWVMD